LTAEIRWGRDGNLSAFREKAEEKLMAKLSHKAAKDTKPDKDVAGNPCANYPEFPQRVLLGEFCAYL
jgi:hypothetical protein